MENRLEHDHQTACSLWQRRRHRIRTLSRLVTWGIVTALLLTCLKILAFLVIAFEANDAANGLLLVIPEVVFGASLLLVRKSRQRKVSRFRETTAAYPDREVYCGIISRAQKFLGLDVDSFEFRSGRLDFANTPSVAISLGAVYLYLPQGYVRWRLAHRDEGDGILAHELSHVAQGDAKFMQSSRVWLRSMVIATALWAGALLIATIGHAFQTWEQTQAQIGDIMGAFWGGTGEPISYVNADVSRLHAEATQALYLPLLSAVGSTLELFLLILLTRFVRGYSERTADLGAAITTSGASVCEALRLFETPPTVRQRMIGVDPPAWDRRQWLAEVLTLKCPTLMYPVTLNGQSVPDLSVDPTRTNDRIKLNWLLDLSIQRFREHIYPWRLCVRAVILWCFLNAAFGLFFVLVYPGSVSSRFPAFIIYVGCIGAGYGMLRRRKWAISILRCICPLIIVQQIVILLEVIQESRGVFSSSIDRLGYDISMCEGRLGWVIFPAVAMWMTRQSPFRTVVFGTGNRSSSLSADRPDSGETMIPTVDVNKVSNIAPVATTHLAVEDDGAAPL